MFGVKKSNISQNDRWIPFNDELTCNLIRTLSTDVHPFNSCTVMARFFRISLFLKKLDFTIVRYDIVLSMLSEVEFDSIGCYFVAIVKRILMDFNALKILWTRKHSSRMRTARFSGPRVCPIPLESDPSLNAYPPGGWPPPLEGTWDFAQNFVCRCQYRADPGFPRGTYSLAKLYQKLHENERNWTELER